MRPYHRALFALAWMGLSGCAHLPWGEGGTSFGTPHPNALVRILGPTQAQLANEALQAHFKATLSDDHTLTFPIERLGQATFEVSPTQLHLERGIINAHFAFEGHVHHDSLTAMQDAQGNSIECTTVDVVGASGIALRFTLESDHLGRVLAIPTDAPWSLTQWNPIERHLYCEGQEPQITTLRSSDLILDAFLLRLAPLTRTALPSALGLDLALSWTQTVAADPLGAGIARLSLHASSPVLTWDAQGIHQVSFQLGTEVEAHPCVAHLGPSWPVSAAPPPDTELQGTAFSFHALVELMHLLWRSGGLCGRSPLTDGTRLEVPLAELRNTWPALDRWAIQVPDATLSLELWPESVPSILPVPQMMSALSPNSFLVQTQGFQLDLIGTLGGARWRLASVLVSFDLEGELVLSPNGALTFELLQAIPTLALAEPGLTFPPSQDLLEGLLTPFIHHLLHGIPLGYVPPSLWPSEVTTGRVHGDYVIFTPTRTVAGAELE